MFMEMFNPRRLSCGVLILNAERELLLCHVTGQYHWDLPKGGSHAGETPLEAALRETREETGLRLDPDALLDLGRFSYRPRKDLHLFATVTPRLDVATLHCDSHFSHPTSGRRLPEMDDFNWFGFAEAPRRCSGKMAAVISDKIELDRLFARLVSQPVAAAPPMRPARPARRTAVRAVEVAGEAS
jgi:8-oxo-dGTP pyrophosphatase MutT (NUDIX family)